MTSSSVHVLSSRVPQSDLNYRSCRHEELPSSGLVPDASGVSRLCRFGNRFRLARVHPCRSYLRILLHQAFVTEGPQCDGLLFSQSDETSILSGHLAFHFSQLKIINTFFDKLSHEVLLSFYLSFHPRQI